MYKRREKPRLRFDAVVKDKKTHRQGITRNISTEGCFIKREGDFQELLPVGSTLELILYLPNTEKNIHIKAIVKHHGSKEDGMGILFKDISPQSAAIIEQFIQTFLDDLSDDEWPGVKEEYRKEVARLQVKTPHSE